MKRVSSVVLMAIAIALAGCASGPFKSIGGGEEKAAAARPDKATIFIYRAAGVTRGAYPKTIFLDGRAIGLLTSSSYFMVMVSPGKHVISSPAANNASVTLHTSRKGVYYVSQEIIPTQPSPYILLNRVNEATGKQGMAGVRQKIFIQR